MIFDVVQTTDFIHDLRGLSPRKFWVAVPAEIVPEGVDVTAWRADILAGRLVEGVPVVGVTPEDGLVLSSALCRALKRPDMVRAYLWARKTAVLRVRRAPPELVAQYGADAEWCAIPWCADLVRFYTTHIWHVQCVHEHKAAGEILLSPQIYKHAIEWANLQEGAEIVVVAQGEVDVVEVLR